MAKYCTKCGKKLEEGKACDCEKKEKKEIKEVETSNDMLNDYIDALKGIITKPVDTMKKYTKKSKFNLALIMLAINVIISGLFVYLFVKEFSTDLYSLMLGSYSSILSGPQTTEIPISVFFYSVLLMALFYFAFAGFLHLICGPIMKKESDFKEVIGLMGVNAVFTTVTTLVALLFVFISVPVAIIILLLGGIIYLFNIYRGFTEISKVDKNKMTYAFVCAYVIALFLVFYVVPKIFS